MSKKYNKKEDFAGISDMLEGRHHVIPIMAGGGGGRGGETEIAVSDVAQFGAFPGVDHADYGRPRQVDETGSRGGERRKYPRRRAAKGVGGRTTRPGRFVPCRNGGPPPGKARKA